jgi:hypothetical protein
MRLARHTARMGDTKDTDLVSKPEKYHLEYECINEKIILK